MLRFIVIDNYNSINLVIVDLCYMRVYMFYRLLSIVTLSFCKEIPDVNVIRFNHTCA